MITFIGAAPAAAQSPLRIVALGDSLIAGSGLDAGTGFVPQMQRWIESRGAIGVEIVNMGVSGDTTTGGRARMDWALAGGADAVILELGANDMLRGIAPEITRENLTAIMDGLTERGLPVLISGMRAALNYGPDYKIKFDAIYPDLAEKYDVIFDPFFFEGLLDRSAMFQPDGLHPNENGVARIVERMGPLVLDLIARARSQP